MAKRVARIVVVTRKTPLELLLERHGTLGQAKFYLSTRQQSIEPLERIHAGVTQGTSLPTPHREPSTPNRAAASVVSPWGVTTNTCVTSVAGVLS